MSQALPVPLVTNEIVHAMRAILGENKMFQASPAPLVIN